MKSRIYERRGPACLTRDAGNSDARGRGQGDGREPGKTSACSCGTQNSPRADAECRRDDGIFITTRFAPGIILAMFPRELRGGRATGGEARFCERVRDSESSAGNEFARRLHVLPPFFFLTPHRRSANVEDMLREHAHDGGVLVSVTYPRVRGSGRACYVMSKKKEREKGERGRSRAPS